MYYNAKTDLYYKDSNLNYLYKGATETTIYDTKKYILSRVDDYSYGRNIGSVYCIFERTTHNGQNYQKKIKTYTSFVWAKKYFDKVTNNEKA